MSDNLQHLAPLLEQSRVLYFVYHVPTRQVTYVSPAYPLIIGGDPAQVNQDLPRWLDLLHPDDRHHLAGLLDRAPHQCLVEDVELRIRHTPDTCQWLCLSACYSASSPNGPTIGGSLRDITRSKEYVMNADKFNSKKNAILEILSHELATPLLHVQQLTALVAEHTGQYHNPELDELIDRLRTVSHDGVNLIRDFVDDEFLQSTHVKLNTERVDLLERISFLVTEYQQAKHMLNLEFVFHHPGHPVYVVLDENKFMQVINNLLSNAIKFTPDGGRITLTLEPRPASVLLTVADTGIGIPHDLQPHLFDKFTKARRPGLRGEKTNGLGLSIIRTIVALHHGRIGFESTEGHGAAFYVEIPYSAPTGPPPQSIS